MDVLAPHRPGTWADGTLVVERIPTGALSLSAAGGRVTVRHSLNAADLGEQLVPALTAVIGEAGLGRREFESALVGVVRSTVDDPHEAWATYYRNSLVALLDGSAAFAPVHAHARSLVTGTVLDLGSCFGFLPLALALTGTEVTATDIESGTMRLLAAVAPRLGAAVRTLVCDAAHVPVPDASVDTVTAIHLLEHVDEDTGLAIVREALRVARERVVVAVPFEDTATECHGHVRTFTLAALRRLGRAAGVPHEVHEHHGGWLVLRPE